ncbi:hypothetical protein BX661DRAFT_183787 [Kickxella alabastrina]|uniref:uncharacterized protein n=1 Tax=Kickxella alabastrina TaxID=61397 RepID=UPI00221FE01C|nr:uncharacterized protein BX661DRAFT_183787 [Kickxella alabastrina]KAI7826319.1 hypothetical protein BX661DRAFT_183787 [Kickxella alabastrina]KAJ1943822.1 hypothetical protein GGF37_002478 [Kickxella alabastrina]
MLAAKVIRRHTHTKGMLRYLSTEKLGQQSQIKTKSDTYGEYHFRKSIERGREAYSVKNVFTALALASGCAGIYFYSLSAVKQENFSDVPMPREPSAEEKAQFEQEKQQ